MAATAVGGTRMQTVTNSIAEKAMQHDCFLTLARPGGDDGPPYLKMLWFPLFRQSVLAWWASAERHGPHVGRKYRKAYVRSDISSVAPWRVHGSSAVYVGTDRWEFSNMSPGGSSKAPGRADKRLQGFPVDGERWRRVGAELMAGFLVVEPEPSNVVFSI